MSGTGTLRFLTSGAAGIFDPQNVSAAKRSMILFTVDSASIIVKIRSSSLRPRRLNASVSAYRLSIRSWPLIGSYRGTDGYAAYPNNGHQ